MTAAQQNQRGGMSATRPERLGAILQGYVDRGEVAGLVALIHRHGAEAYVGTFGWRDKEAQASIGRDTIVRIASMTKPIIAAAALTLVEEGRIRLYDPIDRWLPELANRMVLRDPQGPPNDLYPSPRPVTLHALCALWLTP